MDTKLLSDLGLTEGEIKTYMALLKLGSSTTGPLEKESTVSRSKLYFILDKLEKKGLVSHFEENAVTYFLASEPKKITEYIKAKEKKIKKLEKDFDNFLPNLEALYNENKKNQKVSFHQGFKGILTVHNRTYSLLKRGEEYVYLGIPAEQPSAHHAHWNKDHKIRVSKGIKTRLLFNSDTPIETLKNRNSYKDCDARYMPTNIKTPSYFMIYKDTVMIAIGSGTPIAIEIISQEIADSFMAYFESYWELSKPLE